MKKENMESKEKISEPRNPLDANQLKKIAGGTEESREFTDGLSDMTSAIAHTDDCVGGIVGISDYKTFLLEDYRADASEEKHAGGSYGHRERE